MKKGWKGFVLEMWSCIYGNHQCVFLFKVFFVKIISARMFSIPHIAGGGRLCLERHWPRDRRRHDSWRRLQTFKAKPPGKYGGFGGLIGEFDVPFGSRDKATLEDLYMLNHTTWHKVWQSISRCRLHGAFFWPRWVQQDLLAELWSFACWSCKWGRRTDGAFLEMVWPLAFFVLKQKRNVVFC